MLRTLSAAQASRQEAVTQTRLTVMAGKQKSRFTGKLWGSGALLWEFSMRNSNRNSSECSHYNRSSGWSTLAGFGCAETTTPCVTVNAELHSEWSGTPTQIRPFFLVCFIFVHIFNSKNAKTSHFYHRYTLSFDSKIIQTLTKRKKMLSDMSFGVQLFFFFLGNVACSVFENNFKCSDFYFSLSN